MTSRSGEPRRPVECGSWLGRTTQASECELNRGEAAMSDRTILSRPRGVARLDEEMVELPLLLTGSQAEALEAAAHRRGVTVAQMVRRLVRDFLSGVSRLDRAAQHDPRA